MTGVTDAPAAEVEIDESLVRGLLGEHAGQLAALPIRIVGNGWDNVIARLGDDLVVRLPRRAAAAELVVHEQRWLPVLGPRLTLPVPVPVVAGRPGGGYPWHWSVCRWLPGDTAEQSPPSDQHAAAVTLGRFIVELHQPAPADAPLNPFRGVHLAERAAMVDQRLAALGGVIPAAVGARWAELSAAPTYDGPPRWLHGDLHPSNVLVADGSISAVIDFGDVCRGDPATDLAIAWMMFDRSARDEFFGVVGYDDATRCRAAGWALNLALAYLASSANNPTMAAIGHRTLSAVLADTPFGRAERP